MNRLAALNRRFRPSSVVVGLTGLKPRLFLNMPAYTYYNPDFGPVNLVTGSGGDWYFPVFFSQSDGSAVAVDSSGNPTVSTFAFSIRVGPSYVGTYSCTGTMTTTGSAPTITLHTANGASGFSTSYNAGTHVTTWTFTFDPAFGNVPPTFWITGANTPTNIDIRRTSDVGNANVWQTEVGTLLQDFVGIRTMDLQSTNNDLTTTDWASRHALANVIHIEDLIALANQFSKDLWMQIPGLATNDWIDNFASYVDANLNPGLHLYDGPGNEWWNSATLISDVPTYNTNNELHRALGAKFSFDSPLVVTNAVRASNVVTVTFSNGVDPSRLPVGTKIMTNAFEASIPYKSCYLITSRADPTHLTFASTGADGDVTGSGAAMWFCHGAILNSFPQQFLTATRASGVVTVEFAHVTPLTVGEHIKMTGGSWGGSTSTVVSKTVNGSTSKITFNDAGSDGVFNTDNPSGVDGYYIESTDVSSTLNSYTQYADHEIAWRVRRCADISFRMRLAVGDSKMMTRFRPIYETHLASDGSVYPELKWLENYVKDNYSGKLVKDTLYGFGGAPYVGIDATAWGGWDTPPFVNMSGHSGTPYTVQQYIDQYVWELQNYRQYDFGQFLNQARWAKEYGIKVCGYEGGVAQENPGAGNSDLQNQSTARQDTQVGSKVPTWLSTLGTFQYDTFCWFNGNMAPIGAPNRFDYGFTDRLDTVRPLWQGIKDFNAQASTPAFLPLNRLPAVTTIDLSLEYEPPNTGLSGYYPENNYVFGVTCHAGTYSFSIQGMNVSGITQHFNLLVNGVQVVANVSLPVTANSSTFVTLGPFTVTLDEGFNAFRFVQLDSPSAHSTGFAIATFGP